MMEFTIMFLNVQKVTLIKNYYHPLRRNEKQNVCNACCNAIIIAWIYKKVSLLESFKGNNPEKDLIFIVFRLLLLNGKCKFFEMLFRRKHNVKSFTVLQTLHFSPIHVSAYLVFLRWKWSVSEGNQPTQQLKLFKEGKFH